MTRRTDPAPDGLAFYAPMKAPDDPRPSGDRTMARALLAALGAPDFADRYGPTRLASRLTTRDGQGAPERQAALAAAAETERRLLAAAPAPKVWLTYHCYYKAPDLLGPHAAARGALYAIVEPSRSTRRLAGPWAGFAASAEAAIDRADVLFYMTERDRPALEAALRDGQTLRRLRPFLAETGPAPAPRGATSGALRLLAVGMMRPGDKAASYAALAAGLARAGCDWRLEIVGDGPERAATEALFAAFGDRVRFLGRLEAEALQQAYAAADLFVWPGVNEAYGLVYLEAQARGLPVLCEDRPGVRDVARDGALRTTAEDPGAFAAALDGLAAAPERLRALGRDGRARIVADHSIDAARATLAEGLAQGVAERARRRKDDP